VTPDFRTLPEVQGHPELRIVNGASMDFEQCQTEQWQLVKPYTRDDGTRSGYWVATLEGLRRYGELQRKRREDRITSARERRETEDAWSQEVTNWIEGDNR
jgi:CubicO group peptidase (beta-lactamase class C family)